MKVRSHLALMAAAVLIPVALFSGLALQHLLKSEREAVLRSMAEAARATTLAVDRDWNYAEGAVQALSASTLLATEDFAGFYQQAKVANGDRALHTALLKDSGQQVFNTAVPFGQPIGTPLPAAQERIKQISAAQAPQISNLIIGRATGKPIVTIELPVSAGSGNRYVLSEWRYASELKKAFPMQGVPQSWLIGIFDREGVTISRNRGPDDFVGKPPKDDLLRAILSTNQTVIRNKSRDGLELYTVLARSAQSGWTVAVGVPVAEVEASARSAVLLASLGLVGAVAAALFAALMFGRHLVNAINETARAAAVLGRGSVPSPTVSHLDEVDNVHLALLDAGQTLRRTEEERNALLHTAREAQALAEQQNKAKDQFLAMLGHELRNPLSAISAGVGLLEHSNVTPDAARRGREVIKRQSMLLTHLVDELLDAGRMMTGKLTLSKRQIDLGETAHACMSALQARGLMDHYQVETRVHSVLVDADPTRIEQVINNLLENAFKYTPKGGRVCLEVGHEDGQALIRVSDSGIGISSDLLPKVFDVFVQAPASLGRANGGLGIGLAVVHAMAQQHGGSVTAHSNGEGLGSCFEVRLPISTTARAIEAPIVAPLAVQAEVSKVLLIDDNADARETLSQLLSFYGFHVIQAGTGEQGISQAINHLPHFAVVDIGLPDISGYQVVRRLRQDARTSSMKLIALTGYGQSSDKQMASEVGFDQHLTKPVDFEELVKAVSTPR